MKPSVMSELLTHLNAKTGPIFTDGEITGRGPLGLPPTGVVWSLLAPVGGVQESLDAALKTQKAHIGVIMPYLDSKKAGVRGPYNERQVGGAVRSLNFYVTVFVRSAKHWVLNGDFLWLPDWLEEVFRGFNDSGNESQFTARIADINMAGAARDYLILEGRGEMSYISASTTEVGTLLKGFKVEEGLRTQGVGNRLSWFDLLLEGSP